jgi:hypothetical protein
MRAPSHLIELLGIPEEYHDLHRNWQLADPISPSIRSILMNSRGRQAATIAASGILRPPGVNPGVPTI